MGIDDGDRVHVVEQLDALALGLAEEVPDQRVVVDDGQVVDVLAAVGDVRRLEALGVEPAQVQRQQLLDLGRRQAGLGRRRHVVADVVDGVVEVVHDPRGDGVEAVGLTPDDHGGDGEHGDHGGDGEHPGDRLHGSEATAGPVLH